jgi:hypothetical protein
MGEKRAQDFRGKTARTKIGLVRRIILKDIFRNRMGVCGLNLSGLGEVQVASFCEHVNETGVSIVQEISGLVEDILPSRKGMLHGVRSGLDSYGCRYG